MIGLLTRQITELDHASRGWSRRINPSRQARLRRVVPGIGRIVLAALLGELPELGTLDRSHLASLGGLAPHARESGTWRGVRRLWGDRRKVRETLYLAALAASRRMPRFVAMPDRMPQKSKAPKTILIAAARKLLIILKAMLRNRTPLAA